MVGSAAWNAEAGTSFYLTLEKKTAGREGLRPAFGEVAEAARFMALGSHPRLRHLAVLRRLDRQSHAAFFALVIPASHAKSG